MFQALAAASLALIVFALPAAAQECPPPGYDRARLGALKQTEWAIPDENERRRFAEAIAACVASPDPTLRDGVAFEALSHLLRANQLDVATQNALIVALLPRLQSDDPNGFEAPFAALVLSELARAERLNPHMTDDMRADVLDRALAYFTSVRDYRGFDEAEGWRHGVAHGADLLLQIGIHPAFGKAEQQRVLAAIETQIAPEGHFYIYGEPERLARPLVFIAQRGLISEDEWTAYFARLPAAGENVYASQAGLAWRHNVMAFLMALHMNASISEDSNDDAMLPGLNAALQAMP
ncbi:MAG: DUF2785 domain-containing protein [Hyphomonadaceae bacterium]